MSTGHFFILVLLGYGLVERIRGNRIPTLVLILVLLMKEHPVDGPIGLDREVAREYCCVVNTFTTPSFICW